jgi:xanthine/CO dehydrogenase XdhC/CoxF family maturation factor
LNLGPDAAVILMTHNFEHDREILRFLLTQNLEYIGALGPKKRTEQLLTELAVQSIPNLHAPIGLDIGAQTPETIALSIVSEIQSVIAGRRGGFLKDRNAPIYDRSVSSTHVSENHGPQDQLSASVR